MKQNQSEKRSGKVAIAVLLFLIVAVIAATVVGVVYLIKSSSAETPVGPNNPITPNKTLSLSINGTLYEESGAKIILASGAKMQILLKNIDPKKAECTVGIFADSTFSDFDFMVGEEPYKWSDLKGRNFKNGFKISEHITSEGFEIEFGTVKEILSAVLGDSVTISEQPTGYLFRLVVTFGEQQLYIYFGFPEITGIEVNPDRVIFGGMQVAQVPKSNERLMF